MSTSIGVMVKRIGGLSGTPDVTEWESDFIDSVLERTKCGDVTTGLTPKQVEVIERIHAKHFGGES